MRWEDLNKSIKAIYKTLTRLDFLLTALRGALFKKLKPKSSPLCTIAYLSCSTFSFWPLVDVSSMNSVIYLEKKYGKQNATDKYIITLERFNILKDTLHICIFTYLHICRPHLFEIYMIKKKYQVMFCSGGFKIYLVWNPRIKGASYAA